MICFTNGRRPVEILQYIGITELEESLVYICPAPPGQENVDSRS